MSRQPRFTRRAMVDTAIDLAAVSGPAAVTIAAVAQRVGAPTGSVYHRFASRDELMATAWLEVAASFQDRFLELLHSDLTPAGLAAALHPVQWARTSPHAARVAVLYRHQDFAPGGIPATLKPEAERLAAELDAGLTAFATASFGDGGVLAKQRAAFLLIDLPYAAVRRYVASGITPPPSVDELVRQSFVALSARPPGSD